MNAENIGQLIADLSVSLRGHNILLLVPLFSFCEAMLGIGLFVSGAFLVAVSLLVYGGQPDVLPVLLSLAFLGAFTADLSGFLVGYFFAQRVTGTKLFEKYAHLREKAHRLGEKSMLAAVCIGRLTPVLRSLTPFVVGSLGLHPNRFLMFDLIACTVWISGLALILVSVSEVI